MRRVLLPWDYGDEMIAKIIMASGGGYKKAEREVGEIRVSGRER